MILLASLVGSSAGPAGSTTYATGEFVTDSGNIECANIEVEGNRTYHLPVVHTDPAEQTIDCFVKHYTGPTAHQPCFGLLEFTVTLEFGHYPATDACSGDTPLLLDPHPYHLLSGASANLGGATCHWDDPQLTCTSNSGSGAGFTVSQHSILIPIAPADKVRFAAAGMAENSAVEPPVLQISADATFGVENVHYTAWTQREATGTGLLTTVSCVPDCAGGRVLRTRVRFVLDKPVLACGEFVFTRITWRPVQGSGKSRRFSFGPPVFSDSEHETPCEALSDQHP